MTDLNPSGRMHKRGIGELQHPGCCAVCGNGTFESGYIDIGVYYEYEGQVYLCMACVNEIADTAGMLTDSQSIFLVAQNKEIVDQNERLTHELKVANGKLNHYDALFSDRFNAHPDVIADQAESSEPEQPELSFDGTTDDGEIDESKPIESVEDEGHSDVSGTESTDRPSIEL